MTPARLQLGVRIGALLTMGAVTALSATIGLGAPWTGLVCLIVAAVALFWPNPPDADVALAHHVVDALAGVKEPEALGARLRAALAHSFHNVYLIVVEGAGERAQLRLLHEVLPPTGGAPLPARFAAGELAPVAELLADGRPLHRHQSEGATPEGADPRSSGRFWRTYGLESLWPASPIEGEPCRGLIALGAPVATAPSDRALLAVARLFGGYLTLLEEHESLTGRQRDLQLTVTRANRSLSVALDDLEQARGKLVEAEKQAMIGRLAAGIVHEINTPLGTLGSAADTLERAAQRARQLLEAEEADPARALRALGAQRSSIDVVRQSVARLREVAERVGRFANLDSAEIKSIDLRSCIEDAVALVRAQPSAQEVAFELTLPAEPLEITCFPAKLNHAFFNLVENGAAATEGKGRVAITVERLASSKGLPPRAQVEISDDGRGIPQEKLPGLLDLAFTTRIGGRVGLRTGLPATRQTFAELGGDLTIESEPAKGTRVVASVPLRHK